MEFKDSNIAIVGGGLAGLTLAISLKKRGISATVYELRPESSVTGNSISLGANAIRVLDHIGVYERLVPHGYSYENLTLANAKGNLIANFSNGNKRYHQYPAMRMRRSVVRGELLRKAETLKIPIMYGKKLQSLQESENEVLLEFSDLTKTSVNLLIAADGLHSVVRKHLDPSIKVTYKGEISIYGMTRKEVIEEKLKHPIKVPIPTFYFGASGSFCNMPTDEKGNEVAFWANAQLPERSQQGWDELEHDKVDLKRLFLSRYGKKPWIPFIGDLIEESPLEEFKIWVITDMPLLKRWMSPSRRVIMIGDAVHAMPPHGGQGGAMSFEDAESLACVLARGGSESRNSLLDKWHAHRVQRVKQVLDFNQLAYNLRKASPNPIIQVLKEWFLWFLMLIKGPKGYSWLYGYDAEVAAMKL